MHLAIRLALAAAALVGAPLAGASDHTMRLDSSVIAGDAAAGAHGRVAVNTAAGDTNAQVNSAALAIGAWAFATSRAIQSADNGRPSRPALALSMIEGSAFSNTAGAVSVNQTAGTSNLQVNSFAMSLGVHAEAVSESRLSGVASGKAPLDGVDSSRTRAAVIADGAFAGSRGLAQVNQTAGSGNRTANHVVLVVQ